MTVCKTVIAKRSGVWSTGKEYKPLVLEAGGAISAIASAMETHIDDEEIQAKAHGAMRDLCVYVYERRSRIIESETSLAIVTSFYLYKNRLELALTDPPVNGTKSLAFVDQS